MILEIHDRLPSKGVVVDPRAVFAMLGERAVRASWKVAAVEDRNDFIDIVGDEAAERLEALARSRSRVPGTSMRKLLHRVAQVIWGEFTAYEAGHDEPWLTVRAIDSSWCEVETDDVDVLDRVRRTFADVRVGS